MYGEPATFERQERPVSDEDLMPPLSFDDLDTDAAQVSDFPVHR